MQPVDFGFGEFWGSSYYETLLNTVGLEDIDNLGIKYKFADDKYNLTLDSIQLMEEIIRGHQKTQADIVVISLKLMT